MVRKEQTPQREACSMTCEWRDIPNWVGLYQVSENGRVRSVDRTVVQRSRWGQQIRCFRGKELRLNKSSNGYIFVSLSRPGNRPKSLLVHRLVALTFLGEPAAGEEVCHINGVRADNRASNLRWGTRSSNHADKIRHGTHSRGTRNPQCKVNEEIVRAIRSSSKPLSVLAAQYRISQPTVSDVRNRKSWTWLS